MTRFAAIIFDFDGVIVDSVDIKTKAFAKLYQFAGDEIVKKVIEHHTKHGGVSRYEKIKHYHKDFLRKPLDDEAVNDWAERFSQLVVEAVCQAPEIAGAKDFLENHYSALPLFVASGTPEKELKIIVEQRGLKQYFKMVCGSPATKAELINKIVLENKLPVEKTLMIGDAMTDYLAAEKIGTQFLGIGETESFPVGTEVLPDLNDLTAFIKEAVH
jgi:HAD superfamily hydrolase (TIGR01549 family)